MVDNTMNMRMSRLSMDVAPDIDFDAATDAAMEKDGEEYVIRKGWMDKKGRHLGVRSALGLRYWKKRYFILTMAGISYHSACCEGHLKLRDIASDWILSRNKPCDGQLQEKLGFIPLDSIVGCYLTKGKVMNELTRRFFPTEYLNVVTTMRTFVMMAEFKSEVENVRDWKNAIELAMLMKESIVVTRELTRAKAPEDAVEALLNIAYWAEGLKDGVTDANAYSKIRKRIQSVCKKYLGEGSNVEDKWGDDVAQAYAKVLKVLKDVEEHITNSRIPKEELEKRLFMPPSGTRSARVNSDFGGSITSEEVLKLMNVELDETEGEIAARKKEVDCLGFQGEQKELAERVMRDLNISEKSGALDADEKKNLVREMKENGPAKAEHKLIKILTSHSVMSGNE